MKRIICLLFSIVLTLLLCITASAAGSSTINGNTSVTVGSNIEFTVNVSGCGDATSIAVAVSYDGGFELVSGTWLKSGSITKFDTATNKGALGGLSSPDVNGNLFKLVLKAKTASASNQNVSVNVIAKNGSSEIMNVTPSKSVKIDCASHTYGAYSKVNDSQHKHTCTVCSHNETANHTWNGGTVTKTATCKETGTKSYTCTANGCGATKTETIAKTNNHTYGKWSQTKSPSCTGKGTEARTCSTCQKVEKRDIAATGHKSTTTTTKATVSKDGNIVKACSVCKKTLSTTVIPKISSVKLSATNYVYNGKVKTPSITVKDSKGKTLVKNTDYTVSYASGRKNVGKYAVTISFKGNYSGTKTLYFTINPKSTSISSVSATTKGFTVKWKKQTTQTTGYQIQYSTSSKFSKAKTVTIGMNSITSKTISKLSAKKKYYVRVLTYKTVKINGQATKIYSSWSKSKYVTTKK